MLSLPSRPIGLGLVDCNAGPADTSEAGLKSYALACGEQAAVQEVLQLTGYDASHDIGPDGKVNWAKVALGIGGKVATDATGVPVNVTNILNADGSINARNIVKDVAGIAAAALCTAYGAGAAAPICSFVGGVVGGALYDLGKDVVGLFKGHGTHPESPTSQTQLDIVAQWYLDNRPEYAANVYALRAQALLIASMVDQLIVDWKKHTGETLPWRAMYDKLIAGGLQVPPDWASQLGIPGSLVGIAGDVTDPFTWRFDSPVFHDQIISTTLIEVPEWSIAYAVFGKPSINTRFDTTEFQEHELAGLKALYPQSGDLFELDFASVDSSRNVTSAATVVDVSDKRKKVDEAHIVVDHDHDYVRVDFSPDQAFLVTNGDAAFQKAVRLPFLQSLEPAVNRVGQSMVASKSGGGALTTLAVVGALATAGYFGVKYFGKKGSGAVKSHGAARHGAKAPARTARVVHPVNPFFSPSHPHLLRSARR